MLSVTVLQRPVAAGIFNRAAAVAYADQWSRNEPDWIRNTAEYPDLGNDCTNFVSQVLYAGGMPTQGARDGACYPQEWWHPYTVFGFWKWPHTWSVAECQRQRMQGYPSQFQLWASSDIYAMEGGDVLQMAQDWGPTPTHARVIIGPGYDIVTWIYESQLISQHTAERKRRVWNYNIDPSWPLWNWHVVY